MLLSGYSKGSFRALLLRKTRILEVKWRGKLDVAVVEGDPPDILLLDKLPPPPEL